MEKINQTHRDEQMEALKGLLILGVLFGIPAAVGFGIYLVYCLTCDALAALATAPVWVLPVLGLYLIARRLF